MLREHDISIAAFQEIDVNRASSVGWAVAWKRKGYRVTLGPVGPRGDHRVALASSIPMKPVSLQMSTASDRVAAGLVAWPFGDRTAQVLVVCFYGYPADLACTSEAFSALMEAIALFGGLFVILGDFNCCTQDEGTVASMLSYHVARAADSACLTDPEFTNPQRTRRIDYALTHLDLVAQQVHTFRVPGISDHGLVRVDFDRRSFQPSWGKPHFADFVGPAPSVDDLDPFPLSTLTDLLVNDNLDEAWTLLSDWAEVFLGVHNPVAPRSMPWQPVARSTPCGAPSVAGHEPAPLSALRRLEQRLDQLIHRPWDQWLRGRISRSLRQVHHLVPELPHLDLDFPASALDQVVEMLKLHQKAHRAACLAKWRLKTTETVTGAVNWVKKRAEREVMLQSPLPLETVAAGQVHPADRVKHHGELWSRKWQTPATTADLPAYQRILASLSSHPSSDLDLTPTSDELRRAMKKMKSKAPGSDAWSAKMFLALPASWWDGFCLLWTAVLRLGQVPNIWRRSLVVLLEKSNQSSRPIALLPMAWRAGARAIAWRLKAWVLSWCSPRACGSAPGKSVADVHRRILQAWQQGTRSFVQQDLSAFFDSLSGPVVSATLRHLGAPDALTRLISGFYERQMRLFVVDSHTSPHWRSAHVGLLQGCPLSPVISLCVGHLWTEFVSSTQVESGIFVDDRVLWLRAHAHSAAQTAQAAHQALCRSDQFDQAAGLTCCQRKCHLVTCDPACPWRMEAQHRGYTIQPTLQFLGIELYLDHGGASLLKLCLAKLHARLRHATNPAFSLAVRRGVISSLVFPALFWAAGVAIPSQSELTSVRHSIAQSLRGTLTFEAPRVLVGQVLGWHMDPHWMADWSSLMALSRTLLRPPDWSDELTLDALTAYRSAGYPVAQQTLDRLGWKLDVANRSVSRIDDQGLTRVCHLGEDSLLTLRHWLIEEYKRTTTASCGRIQRRQHRGDRGDPSLAVGLDLPRPNPRVRFAFAGHAQLYKQATTLTEKRACLATGGTAWHFNARRNGTMATCMCGREWPSRSHLLWTCPALANERSALTLPENRVEERLMGHPILEYPAAPTANDQQCRDQLVQFFVKAVTLGHHELLFATDGSSQDGVGSYAIACNSPPGQFAGADSSEDQSPFRMELRALDELFAALVEVHSPPRKLWVLVDCQAAIKAMCRPHSCGLRLLAERLQANGKLARLRGTEWSLIWVPSHGKQASWSPPSCCPVSSAMCRQLNQQADDAAKSLCQRRHHGSARASWHRAFEHATQNEQAMIRIAVKSSLRLEAHLGTDRDRVPVPPSIFDVEDV
ncbi:pol [Symbiodinium natans]|uniref:Pol protein n=1 Tax=Symbiodinium natans TaxID=878477 RepID=A0A812NT44_9DINO|nr:pol [Symbiodinium natans]